MGEWGGCSSLILLLSGCVSLQTDLHKGCCQGDGARKDTMREGGGPPPGGALAANVAAFVAFVILKSLRGTQSGGCSKSICPPPPPPLALLCTRVERERPFMSQTTGTYRWKADESTPPPHPQISVKLAINLVENLIEQAASC